GAVSSITSVVLTGIQHTYIGDLQIVLVDPTGAGHNLLCRHLYPALALGNSYNFNPGTNITFDDAGQQWPAAAGDVPTGTYVTYGGAWTSGNLNITNGNLSAITGPAGTWTLMFYDWAAIDTGALVGWTLNGTSGSIGPGTTFCVPGQAGVMACVCNNPNGAG